MENKVKLDKYEKLIDALVVTQNQINKAYQYLDELNICSFSIALISLGFKHLAEDIAKHINEKENEKELLQKIIKKLELEGVE